MDLIPVGYTPLLTAFEIFRNRKPLGECKAAQELRDPSCLNRFGHERYVALFDEVVIFERRERNAFLDEIREGRLNVFVSVAEATNVAIVPTGIWNMGDYYVEMTFRTNVFHIPPFGDWPRIGGRTPFLETTAFNSWLEDCFSTRRLNKQGAGRISAETACQQWLANEMRKTPRHKPEPKASYEVSALNQFVGLSKRGFGRAWDAAIAETGVATWSNPGRPSKEEQE